MEKLAGRVAFITGGANGIGFGIARALAEAGVRIAVADVDRPSLQKAEAELGAARAEAIVLHCDVADRQSLERAAEEVARRLGAVHLLCNNAGVAVGGPLDQVSDADWRWGLSVNLEGVVNGLQTFLPRILAHGEGGHVVNTASLAGLIAPPGLGIYTATKYAVVGLSEVLRQDLAGRNVSVSVLCPGLVNTSIFLSGRHRPESLGGPVHAPEGAGAILRERGMDPLEVGRKVRRGVERNDMYILTHPESRGAVERRFRALSEAFDSWEPGRW